MPFRMRFRRSKYENLAALLRDICRRTCLMTHRELVLVHESDRRLVLELDQITAGMNMRLLYMDHELQQHKDTFMKSYVDQEQVKRRFEE